MFGSSVILYIYKYIFPVLSAVRILTCHVCPIRCHSWLLHLYLLFLVSTVVFIITVVLLLYVSTYILISFSGASKFSVQDAVKSDRSIKKKIHGVAERYETARAHTHTNVLQLCM